MNSSRLFFTITLFLSWQFSVNAATVLNDSWSNVVNGKCSDQSTAWWSSAEAIRIVNNVLLYQKDCGGFGKNINMQLVLTDAQKATLKADKPKNTDCCIDNGAVTYELMYLSKVHKAITNDSIKNVIKTAFTKGILYLQKAQYANGGWPQYFPLKSGYYLHITYNDNAMINVMEILRRIYKKDAYYSITLSDSIANVAKIAFDKGVACVLKTQIVQNNRLTGWCAQHNYITLAPVMARSYELASVSGGEAANILKLLVSLENPSKEIKRAIHSLTAWYDRSRIKGQRLVSFTNTDGLSDKKIVLDATAPDMWARFYTLTDNRPFFCYRDGIVKYSIAEIGYERRNGYSWYNSSGNDVASAYNTWLPKYGTTILASPLPNSIFNSTDSIPIMAFANKNTGSTLTKFEMIIDGQTSQTVTDFAMNTWLKGLSGGEHTLIVKSEYANGRIEADTCNIVVKAPSALNSVEGNKSQLTCYPNPATNGFTVDLQGEEMTDIAIFNLNGQFVFNAKPFQSKFFVNINALTSGIYCVRAEDIYNKLHVQRVIIQP
jgi:pectinesterase